MSITAHDTNHTSVEVTEPGVYDAMPDSIYHADPVPSGSLSSTGARKLLPPSCPALFDHWHRNGQTHRAAFDFGQAAHRLVLGAGANIAEVTADDWRSKTAQQQKTAAYDAGQVPLLTREVQQVRDMAAAIRAHPIAGALLDPEQGRPEQSAFWRDPASGVWCRARFDWLPHDVPGQRMLLTDYKTTASAAPDAIEKSVYQYGYHQQAAWYLDAAMDLQLTTSEPAFLFIFQEKTAPYLVTVTQLTSDALMWGGELNRKARDLYAQCTATGRWPGYADDVIATGLPVWAERQYEAARERGDLDTTNHTQENR